MSETLGKSSPVLTDLEEISVELQALLQGITTANGFSQTVAVVERQREDWDQITPDGNFRFPAIFLNEVSDDPVIQVLEDLYRKKVSYNLVILVCVVDWQAQDPDTHNQHGKMATAVHLFKEEVTQRLRANKYLVTSTGRRLAYKLTVEGTALDEGYHFPMAVMIMAVDIVYYGDSE